MNNREEIFKKEKKLGITQQEPAGNIIEDMVIERIPEKADKRMDGLSAWWRMQQVSLPTIEY